MNRITSYERNVDPRTGRPRSVGSSAPCVSGYEAGCLPIQSASFTIGPQDPHYVDPERNSGAYPANPAAGTQDSRQLLLENQPVNQQLYTMICATSIGFNTLDTSSCAQSIFNSTVNAFLEVPTSNLTPGARKDVLRIGGLLSNILAGNASAAQLGTNFLARTQIPTVPLNADPCDKYFSDNNGGCTGVEARSKQNFYAGNTLNLVLTDEQEALLGCGPFYGTDCESDGIDLLNVEASVMMQSFVGTEGTYSPTYFAENFSGWYYGNGLAQPGTLNFQGTPVGLYNESGQIIQVAGSRGPGDPGYNVNVDGSTAFTNNKKGQCAGVGQLSIPCGTNGTAPSTPLPDGGFGDSAAQIFRSEMAALSFNMQMLLVAFSTAPTEELDKLAADPNYVLQIDQDELNPQQPFSRAPNQCSFAQPQFCGNNKSFFSISGAERNSVRAGGNGLYGRRDFVWQSGGEGVLQYQKRNVFGFSLDFAEDVTKTNWSSEMTWIANNQYNDNDSLTGRATSDTVNLTVSVDRPTFINFLNSNRTFFFNSQVFFQYITELQGGFHEQRSLQHARDLHGADGLLPGPPAAQRHLRLRPQLQLRRDAPADHLPVHRELLGVGGHELLLWALGDGRHRDRAARRRGLRGRAHGVPGCGRERVVRRARARRGLPPPPVHVLGTGSRAARPLRLPTTMRNRTLLAIVPCLLLGAPARAVDLGDRFSIHGYGEITVRMLDDNFRTQNANLSQWMNVLNLEAEGDLAPDGFGPFDALSIFARGLVRYDCIYNGCGMLPTWRYYGDRATRVPSNYSTAYTNPYNGTLRVPSEPPERVADGNKLVNFFVIPPWDALKELGASNVDGTFAPISDARFAVKNIDATIGSAIFSLGPWQPSTEIDPTGTLSSVPSPTLPLPLRPQVPTTGAGLVPHGLFVPSQSFTANQPDLKDFEQNYSQDDLAWFHTDSQDEYELKELYIDAEMFDGRLWMRLGKQSIVWGKTELFRTTDQFNPQTLNLSSLPSLEESRIPLWSVRGTWSFYDVGPLEDLRLEVAANLDEFEPLELGRCGQPYTVWLVCGKTFGLWSHGFAGIGIAGERHPDPFWQSVSGVELGARLEWRWDRFSFQLSDFWGYDDAPTIDAFNEYTRRVDEQTGKPLDVNGNPLVPGEDAAAVLALHPANRQLFDVICSATKGIAATALGGADAPPEIKDACLVDIVNNDFPLNEVPNPAFPFPITPAMALSVSLTGNASARLVAGALATGATLPPGSMVELNRDPADGEGSGFFGAKIGLGAYLTQEQEALLGCGDFYGTNCDDQGIDLFNAEASVLIQSFPEFEAGGPVATRYAQGQLMILPGARGPGDAGYSPLVDGCTSLQDSPLCAQSNDGKGARGLYKPGTTDLFPNEMGALSYNFMILLAALGSAAGTDPGCDINDPFSCAFVRGVFGIAGARRPGIRAGGNENYGRRDFIWSGGSEIQLRYPKRNVFGFATDFAHDGTGTNWSIEATWIAGQSFGIQTEERGYGFRDTYNMTISVDRPTFINFLNPGRTFFMNAQLFMRYIDGYEGGGEFGVSGPFSALGTFSVFTGYFQDRLLPGVTWVHDVNSNSGGLITQVTYRFSQDFSATVGVAGFYGDPGERALALTPPVLTNQGGNYKSNTNYDGLSAIAERDEVFLSLRYTF